MAKKPAPALNLVDRFVATLNPAAGLRRLQARAALAAAVPAYEAASRSTPCSMLPPVGNTFW